MTLYKKKQFRPKKMAHSLLRARSAHGLHRVCAAHRGPWPAPCTLLNAGRPMHQTVGRAPRGNKTAAHRLPLTP
jgi:hypothetical protein